MHLLTAKLNITHSFFIYIIQSMLFMTILGLDRALSTQCIDLKLNSQVTKRNY